MVELILLSSIPWKEVILFLFGAGGGGALWKFYDIYIRHKQVKFDNETTYRNELKQDIDSLRNYVTQIENDYRDTKEKYIGLYKDHTRLQIAYEQLKFELDQARIEIDDLKQNKRNK